MYGDDPHYLFDGETSCLAELLDMAVSRVRSQPDDVILDSDPDWLVSAVMATIHVEPIEVDFDGATRDAPIETSVMVNDYKRHISIPALIHRIRVPFTGYAPLLHRTPSTSYSMCPEGRVQGDKIVFEYTLQGLDHGEKLKSEHTRNVDLFKKYLANTNADLENVLGQVPRKLAETVQQRRREINAKRTAGDTLGIPIAEPEDTEPRSPDLIRLHRVVPRPGQRTRKAPVSMAEFDGILDVVETAGVNFERHPRMTRDWGEDEFRDAVNGYLNLIYAKTGSVTGETFIRSGKSDIVIRDQDVDVFIAECKIWGGQARVHQDMNQLFDRYLTWRATKAALIYFSRGKNTSDAVAHLKEQVQAHPCHLSTSQAKNETHLRFKFHHPSDGKRRFDLAVLLFPVET